MTDITPLFEPLSIRGMSLPNRVVMAPMTRSFSPTASLAKTSLNTISDAEQRMSV